jgi:hypothetical protein
MTGEDGPGFMPAGDPTLWSAEKLVASYCERFGLPKGRDPYSLIIWRQGEYKGLSLRASKAHLDAKQRKPAVPLPEAEEELWREAARERAKAKAIARYNMAEARARVAVEGERLALAEQLARKAAAEEEAREAAAPAPAKPSVAAALTLIQAKEAILLQELASLEDLKAAQERIKTLESQIEGLKMELDIE